MIKNRKDRKFMEIAIKEMLKSRSEHTNKFDPMVGAVIVGKDGKVLGRAHRGCLRKGDHAEFTLIERLLVDKDLEKSTLYVTLEPCTKRNPPKKPCVERIISARIGRVVIGIPDPNPDVLGKGINYLLKNSVRVTFFDSDLSEGIRKQNTEFIKQQERISKSPKDIHEKFVGPSGKEKEPVPSASIKDFSLQEVRKYLRSRRKSLKVPSSQLWIFFHKNGYVTK